jgi:hypothetical protein
MPLSKHARQVLNGAMASTGAAKRLADVIDAGSGTLDADVRRRLVNGMANRRVATTFIAKVQTSAALSSIEIRHLGNMLGDNGVANEINTQLSL